MRELTTTVQAMEAPTHGKGLECSCCGKVVEQDMCHALVLRLILDKSSVLG